MTRAVLGIDAAWTANQPTGVALVEETSSGWALVRVSPSYAHFHIACGRDSPDDPAAGAEVLHSAARATRSNVAIIAADIPLSNLPISGRRVSDNAVSSAYGARHASTHSPSPERPGPIGAALTAGYGALGYPLLTTGIAPRGLMEVYPHPALIELTGAAKRLPYKCGKTNQYWRGHSLAARRENLIAEWQDILAHLDKQIAGVADALMLPSADAPLRILKAFEDSLDAVICAWVGVCALQGRALPLGDATSAIWVPMSALAPQTVGEVD